jgi:uncharacterized protein DUF6232
MSGGGSGGPRPMVYYADETITITGDHVYVGGRTIPVADLRRVVRSFTYTYPAVKVACITGGIELALGVPLAAALGSSMMLLAGALSGVGVAAGAWADVRRNPRRMTIEAEVRGHQITLISTSDRKAFVHIRLALLRAIEQQGSSLL